jgi:hypothetical protein
VSAYEELRESLRLLKERDGQWTIARVEQLKALAPHLLSEWDATRKRLATADGELGMARESVALLTRQGESLRQFAVIDGHLVSVPKGGLVLQQAASAAIAQARRQALQDVRGWMREDWSSGWYTALMAIQSRIDAELKKTPSSPKPETRSHPASETPEGDVHVIVVTNVGDVHRWRMIDVLAAAWADTCECYEVSYWFYDPGAPVEAREQKEVQRG